MKLDLVGEEPGFNPRLAELLNISHRRVQNYSTSEDTASNRRVDPAVRSLMNILKWLKDSRIKNPFINVD